MSLGRRILRMSSKSKRPKSNDVEQTTIAQDLEKISTDVEGVLKKLMGMPVDVEGKHAPPLYGILRKMQEDLERAQKAWGQ